MIYSNPINLPHFTQQRLRASTTQNQEIYLLCVASTMVQSRKYICYIQPLNLLGTYSNQQQPHHSQRQLQVTTVHGPSLNQVSPAQSTTTSIWLMRLREKEDDLMFQAHEMERTHPFELFYHLCVISREASSHWRLCMMFEVLLWYVLWLIL